VFYSDPFGLLVFSALVKGVAAAPFLIVTMLIARDRQVMGKYRNGIIASVLGWPTAFIMSAAAVIGVWLTFRRMIRSSRVVDTLSAAGEN